MKAVVISNHPLPASGVNFLNKPTNREKREQMDTEEFVEGFGVGACLILAELMFLALFLAGNAVISASTMDLLTIVVSMVCFVQSMIFGSTQSEGFLIGFFFGSLLALLIARQLSQDMVEPVTWGILADMIGTGVGAIIANS
jgi:hypothetical protein